MVKEEEIEIDIEKMKNDDSDIDEVYIDPTVGKGKRGKRKTGPKRTAPVSNNFEIIFFYTLFF